MLSGWIIYPIGEIAAYRKLIDVRDIGGVANISLASCSAPSGPRGAPGLNRLNVMPPVPDSIAITPCSAAHCASSADMDITLNPSLLFYTNDSVEMFKIRHS